MPIYLRSVWLMAWEVSFSKIRVTGRCNMWSGSSSIVRQWFRSVEMSPPLHNTWRFRSVFTIAWIWCAKENWTSTESWEKCYILDNILYKALKGCFHLCTCGSSGENTDGRRVIITLIAPGWRIAWSRVNLHGKKHKAHKYLVLHFGKIMKSKRKIILYFYFLQIFTCLDFLWRYWAMCLCTSCLHPLQTVDQISNGHWKTLNTSLHYMHSQLLVTPVENRFL